MDFVPFRVQILSFWLYFEFGNDKGAANENEKYRFSNLLPLLKKFLRKQEKDDEKWYSRLKIALVFSLYVTFQHLLIR